MTKEDIIRMALGAELNAHGLVIDRLERFAALVAAHERKKVAKWMVERSFATGHGDTIEDLLEELYWQIVEKNS